ncbi:hypothetical protein BDV28DRAFT_129020 [Aspergillus coremiiformis]|uniref:Nucleic acid-binding protein n=1 Tax=Aspergillus coremiiformis TaxID=138285 RepID=A0A5N6ZCM2_9EURO|nr:hypothetical protein BDV28DRAFT_129020 [Aspergillus coremiiformis]
MRPSNLVWAMQPLRTSIVRSTPTSSPAHIYSAISTPFRRLNSTTATPTENQPSPAPSTPSVEPLSLRRYPYALKTGTVVSVGRMDRTVRVAHRHTIWDKHIHKTYPKVTMYLVADPRNSLREGDVIEFASGYPKTRNVHYVVERIVGPFGEAIEDRPAVMTREEREAERVAKTTAKLERREARRAEKGESQSSGPRQHVGRIRRLIQERVGAQ